jgi:fumarate hydratase class I
MYHCGPIMKKQNGSFTVVAAGPTTSMRVEPYESVIIAEYGIRGVMGKGGMGRKTLEAMKRYGCVYFHTIGGAAVYLAGRIKKVDGVWMLDVENFPAIVTMDAFGRSLHDEIEKMSRHKLEKLLKLP